MHCIYRRIGEHMTKRLVDIDDETLEEAQRVLGTATIEDTVNTALIETVRATYRREKLDREAAERFAAASRDLLDDDVRAEAWR